ncbi:Dyp-type peroxidase [Arthrobacter halodurans]|uniref:Dyp-type peroxidase n=1 Tax=Arthrobacter halodurans TaxID=516699 RepID=A0ABV4UPT6_9MICC
MIGSKNRGGRGDTGPGPRPNRRAVIFGTLGYAGATAAHAAPAPAGTGAPGSAVSSGDNPSAPGEAGVDTAGSNGARTLPFHGRRQAGVDTAPTAHISYLGLDLSPAGSRAQTREAARRLLVLLSGDASRLAAGRGTLADTEPELAGTPARLSVTFGFGPRLLGAVAPASSPPWLRPLEPFAIDRLDGGHGQTDLVLAVGSDDPLALAHARRALLKDAGSLAATRWVQDGFRTAYGSAAPGATARNLFGQLDGTGNPGGAGLERAVWGGEGLAPWIDGGTSLVLRRISMDLDRWDEVDRPGRDFALGRHQDTGAPLGGTLEHERPDPAAADTDGLPLMSADSHVARSLPRHPDEVILRRAHSYQSVGTGGVPGDSGLLFASYQADIDRQFLPIQRRLAESDMLNEWTTPVGSAVYAVPPGCAEGGFVGDALFG